jgi:arylsulfatase A-like enzyme
MAERLSRRDFMKRSAAMAVGVALGSGCALTKGGRKMPDERPNLLFVFPDEMRQQAMGFLGRDPVITPNLDRFAAGSLFLPNAVSNYPVCSPYRAMLLTGKYPHANGVTGNCTPDSHELGVELRADETCISDILKSVGYDCGYIGKWHLDSARPPNIPDDGPEWWDCFIPKDRRHGFDFWHAYNCFDDHFNPHYWTADAGLNGKIHPRKWSPEYETDVAIDFIRSRGGERRQNGRPFALFVSHNPPHMPFHMVPEKYVRMYGAAGPEDLLVRPNAARDLKTAREGVRNYFAMVTGVDDNFGRLLKCLKDEGLEDDTIVVFTSDHGEMMGSHALMHKQQPYEESFLVPFLVRWPGKLKPGKDGMHMSVPDLMPTLLGLLGVTRGIPGDIQGKDCSPILLGRGGERPEFAAYYGMPPEAPHLGRRGLRTDRYTFVVAKDREGKGSVVLYDNEADPYQTANVSEANPRVVEELKGKLAGWLEKTHDPFGLS